MNSIDEHGSRIPLNGDAPRQCRFCRRDLHDDFRFCPFCGRRVDRGDGSKTKWYHSQHGVAFAFILLGPFALPFVWSNPRYSAGKKAVITVITLAVTFLVLYALVALSIHVARQLTDLLNNIG